LLLTGAVLRIGMDGSRFSLEAVKAKLHKYGSVLWHLSRTEDNVMQMVIREPGEYTGESVEIAKKLFSEIKNGMIKVKKE
jgi:hypothetical protein